MLDAHFIPKRHTPFERHVFRQLYQDKDETVDQFVCRLLQKAAYCDFHNVDEVVKDQLEEKCSGAEMRKKFLEQKSDATLQELQDVARRQPVRRLYSTN